MLLRVLPLLSVLALAACSSSPFSKSETAKTSRPLIKYSQGNSKIVPVNPVASSNNLCVDHFNFLRQAGDEKYQRYSRNYIDIGNGFNFLNTNKNIMNVDAKRIYTNELDMKLNTLCSEVKYAGFMAIQKKISELDGI